jgi:predicted nucleic acid-binding protein
MASDLLDGDQCFLDANIFYYHFVETPAFSGACTRLLERVATGDVLGYTSTHILSEAIHKVMIAEAADRFGLNRSGLVNWLQNNPARIGELSDFQRVAHELGRMRLLLLHVDANLFGESAGLSKHLGLLTNDAMVVALMRRQGLSILATNDDDFSGIPGLTIWSPRTVPV